MPMRWEWGRRYRRYFLFSPHVIRNPILIAWKLKKDDVLPISHITVRTFLPLWHNVLPIITLDCLISSYHKVTRCEIILQFLPLRLVINQSPNAELSEVRGGISCSHCTRSEVRF